MLNIKTLRYLFLPKASSKWIKNRCLNELFAFYAVLATKLRLKFIETDMNTPDIVYYMFP